jgi:hypothetical protein
VVRFLAEAKKVPLACVSRPALGPTQPPIQWAPGIISPGVNCGRGLTLTLLVPRLRTSRRDLSSPPSACIVVAGHLYFSLHKAVWSLCCYKCTSTQVRAQKYEYCDSRLNTLCNCRNTVRINMESSCNKLRDSSTAKLNISTSCVIALCICVYVLLYCQSS